MNNTYTQILTTLVRVFVVWLMGALASHLSKPAYNLVNNIIIQIGGTDALVLAIVGLLGTAGWGIWTRLQTKVHLDTALILPPGSNTQDVKNASPNPLSALIDPKAK